MIKAFARVFLIIIMMFGLVSCGTKNNVDEKKEIETTTKHEQETIPYIIHEKNCALGLKVGSVTDLNYRTIKNPWDENRQLTRPMVKPLIYAPCGCVKREYPQS